MISQISRKPMAGIRTARESDRIRTRRARGPLSPPHHTAPRNDNLDIAWLRDTEAEAEEQLTEPEDIAAAIIGHLKAALEDIETLSEELEPNGGEKPAAAEAAE